MQSITPSIERANTRHLYWDMFWMCAAFAVDWYFLQVFAIRMNATPLQIGLLVSLRAAFLVVGSTLANYWRHRYKNPIPAMVLPIIAYRALLYLPVVFVVYLPLAQRVDMLVFLVALSSIPTGISQGIFLGMMRYAVHQDNLASLVARRSILMNAGILVWVLGIGQFLEHVPFPLNYQISFGVAFLVSLLSLWHIWRIKCPDRVEAASESSDGLTLNVWKNSAFVRFAVILVAINASVFISAPLIPLQLVRALNASDAWISAFGVFEMGAGALLMMRMSWLIARFGTAKLIVVTTFMTAFHTLILGMTTTLPPYLIGVLLFGAGWYAVNVLLYNWLVEIVPHEDFPHYAAAYQLLINISLFVGPLLGTFLVTNLMTIPAALILIALVRVAAAYLAWALRPEPIAAVLNRPVEVT